MWYLPWLLPNKLHARILLPIFFFWFNVLFADQCHRCTRGINQLLSGSVKAPCFSCSQGPHNPLPSNVSWRISKSRLMPPSACRKDIGRICKLLRWVVCLRTHCNDYHFIFDIIIGLTCSHQTAQDVLKPSYNLCIETKSKDWLNNIREVEQYINALLSLSLTNIFTMMQR